MVQRVPLEAAWPSVVEVVRTNVASGRSFKPPKLVNGQGPASVELYVSEVPFKRMEVQAQAFIFLHFDFHLQAVNSDHVYFWVETADAFKDTIKLDLASSHIPRIQDEQLRIDGLWALNCSNHRVHIARNRPVLKVVISYPTRVLKLLRGVPQAVCGWCRLAWQP